jgi:hypothetical protein
MIGLPGSGDRNTGGSMTRGTHRVNRT